MGKQERFLSWFKSEENIEKRQIKCICQFLTYNEELTQLKLREK